MTIYGDVVICNQIESFACFLERVNGNLLCPHSIPHKFESHCESAYCRKINHVTIRDCLCKPIKEGEGDGFCKET